MKLHIRNLALLALGGSLFIGAAIAQPASDEQMSLDAIRSELGPIDEISVKQLYTEAVSEIRRLAKNSSTGEEVIGVAVVFNRGKTPIELEEMADEYGFEVVAVQIKHPSGDQGAILTYGIGAFSLMLLPGTLSERLALAAGRQQTMMPGRDASGGYAIDSLGLNQSMDALRPDFKIYQAQVVVTLDRLNQALDQEDFAVLSLDPFNRIVDSYNDLVEKAAKMSVRPSGQVLIRPKPGQSFQEAILDSLPPGIPRDRVIINRPLIPPPLN